MRRIIQCSTTVLLSLCTTLAFAGGYDYPKEDLSGYNLQPNFKVSDESDWTRSGNAVYFFGGYVYANRFLKNTTKTFTSGSATITYKPKSVYPKTFSGVEFGFGKEFSQHIDLQMAYLQYLKETKTTGSTAITSKMNAVMGDVGYVFNPDDEFQVMLKAGAVVGQFYTTSLDAGTTYFPLNDTTKIDPNVGLDFLFQFTKSIGFRVSAMYIADVQSVNSSGEANILAGLNYTL